ncbi:YlbD family protein [Alkalihalobacterium elongatum]|uniref:YlbD family protein n=1 Tax=Alkalihalobacterium elongatum TaxID=2675466 RepID=UPI001C200DEB|nr:YlbD family protein [Alkalihalobacterium elongatum]
MPSNSNNLHPSVQQFKAFVKEHPLLIREVRSGNRTWQDYYEEWTLLGEDHPNWQKYRRTTKTDTYESSENINNSQNSNAETNENNSESSSTTAANLLGMLKNINFNDLQHHMAQVSSVITNVQGLMQSFQGNNQQSQQQPRQDDPFSFRRH